MTRQIFFDPQRKRWKRLRRILDVIAVFSTVILVLFFLGIIRNQKLPELLLPTPKRNYKALNARQTAAALRARNQRSARRRTQRRPSEIPLNSGEGLRAAYYVDDDPGSYSSLKSHIHQIDMLFPQWLYVFAPDGRLQGGEDTEYPARVFDVIDAKGVRSVDPQNKVRDLIAATHEETEIYPMLSNYNVLKGDWDPDVSVMLKNPAARQNLEQQLSKFFAANPSYRGLSLDLEELPDDSIADYHCTHQ